ncbi:aldehyde dehydrogenase (NAD) family protein [Besnoitia besnoiti]|uniref:Aldehyde dehydrogenase (NAD) family protein n=1 Tax=Besnoitia besnoiti TaxID=94643 RepID=A0A2A9M9Z3_BESBE|nr:aldehyde dehydrogenase (NAD) family protein [Besnoitia besnoiti]PFH32202.1 aldehyde dehydrogenase (NAD) family protein [Besnoitia besnoiti]
MTLLRSTFSTHAVRRSMASSPLASGVRWQVQLPRGASPPGRLFSSGIFSSVTPSAPQLVSYAAVESCISSQGGSAERAHALATGRQRKRAFSSSVVKAFANVDPDNLSGACPHTVQNLVQGKWTTTRETYDVVDPMNGDAFIKSPYTKGDELEPFIASLKAVPKSGLHNPLKNPERYVLYGQILQKTASMLHDERVFDFFTRCILRTFPKSYKQAAGEVRVVRAFCENFSGDSIRFLARGFSVPGDHPGQLSNGFRWPFGPVAVVSPFNFPLEIPVMQFLAAVMVGNKPVVKTEATQALPVEQFLRLLHYCGMPMEDVDLLNTRGPVVSELLTKAPVRLLQFTGGSATAEHLIQLLKGRVKVEDAGFDWKILGPEAKAEDVDYVAWQCDQDAYALSGQKCSAQSLLAFHSSWKGLGLLEKLKELASRRSYDDLTLSPVLSHSNEEIQKHVDSLLKLPNACLLFGGKAVQNATTAAIPAKYGAYEPTAVFVPLGSILMNKENLELATTELFGPVQVVTEWKTGEEQDLLRLLEQMKHHLTAAVVSRDPTFQNLILANTVNGTTYAGLRARTTGAPQNHWFGPAGDPLGAGIGSPEAVLCTWTCHREIVSDQGPIPASWTTPPPS